MKKFFIISSMLILSLSDIGFAAKPVNRIIAVVNDNVITAAELNRQINLVKNQMTQANVKLPDEKTLIHQVLDKIIAEKLQLEVAEKTNLQLSEAEVTKALQNIAERNHKTIDELYASVKSEGWSVPEFREEIKREVILQKLQDREVVSHITITPQEIDDATTHAKTSLTKDRSYHIRDILTPSQTKAQTIVKQLKSIKNLDEALSELTRKDPSVTLQDLGWRKADALPEIFVNYVKTMETGQLSLPIQTPNGWHILYLAEMQGEKVDVMDESEVKVIFIKNGEGAEEKIKNIASQLEKNKNNFEALVNQYSENPTREQKGYLGWINSHNEPELYNAVDSLNPGDYSAPTQAHSGFYILQLLDKRQHAQTGESNKKQVQSKLFQQKIQTGIESFVNTLKSQAYIKIYE